ncbi:MAG: M20/M25/M40 family metallo-hydrolase [Candidatus Krumholzibacteriaceae bacterium]|jgi:hypothetical protein
MREVKRALLRIAVPAALGVILLLGGTGIFGADRSPAIGDRIIAAASEHPAAMQHLAHLVNDIGKRPVGSRNFVTACKWARDEFRKFGIDNAHLEEVEWKDGTDYNVVADVKGTDRPDEYVIVGAHIDAAPETRGATDDGAGVAAIMEAARILSKADARPSRTIRFILFGGEEVGLIGSKAYLASHPDIVPKVSAVYVMDHGANFISGIDATAPLAADLREAFSRAATLDAQRPFAVKEVEYLSTAGMCSADGKGSSCGGGNAVVKRMTREEYEKSYGPLGASDSSGANGRPRVIRVIGSSDYAPFLHAGIPAFPLNQVVDEAHPYPAHTAEDTYDKVDPVNLEHSAKVIALGALGTANLDHMLSREKLTNPSGEAGSDAGCCGEGAQGSGCGAGKSTNAPCCGSQGKKI